MSFSPLSSYAIVQMTFEEIARHLKIKPVLILPLGVLEPCSDCGALGAASLSCAALADRLSHKKSILLAPLATYGYSTAYKAFPGTGALSRRTVAALLRDLLNSWLFQGVRGFIIIDGNAEDDGLVKESVKRPLSRRSDVVCSVLNWQSMPSVRAFIAENRGEQELHRSEFGILSMAAYIDGSFVRRLNGRGQGKTTVDQNNYQQWRKRGRDPEQFRKLYPDSRTSPIAYDYCAEFGKNLFHFISATFEETVSRNLNVWSL